MTTAEKERVITEIRNKLHSSAIPVQLRLIIGVWGVINEFVLVVLMLSGKKTVGKDV